MLIASVHAKSVSHDGGQTAVVVGESKSEVVSYCWMSLQKLYNIIPVLPADLIGASRNRVAPSPGSPSPRTNIFYA